RSCGTRSMRAASLRSRGLGVTSRNDKVQQTLIPADANHVSRGHVAKHGIGYFKPKTHLLHIAAKKLSNKIGDVCNLAQSFRNRFGNIRIEAHRGLRDLRDFS